MRIDDLLDLFVETDSGTGTADKTAFMETNLETISKKVTKAADYLERTLEMFDEDRYLEWLLRVPANSPLFQRRRAQVRGDRPAQYN